MFRVKYWYFIAFVAIFSFQNCSQPYNIKFKNAGSQVEEPKDIPDVDVNEITRGPFISGLSSRGELPELNLVFENQNVVEKSFEKVFEGTAGLFGTLNLVSSPDNTNRIFAATKDGRVVDVNNGNILLNISTSIQTGGEQGLLGFAFSPNFSSNGYVYVYYSRAGSPLGSVISRFNVNNNKEIILLEFTQPRDNHNGGTVVFNPLNGYLYISSGDGGKQGDPDINADDPENFLGKILRIIPNEDDEEPALGNEYTIPIGNRPADGDEKPEIYAMGLRNPWKMSFDTNGDLWIGDVGQGSREEINRISADKEQPIHFGWPFKEGNIGGTQTDPRADDEEYYTKPVYDYGHSNGLKSVTGGFVYRGSEVPDLIGKYIFGDLQGEIWVLNGNSVEEIGNSGNLVGFGVDYNNELYALSFNNGIEKLVNTATNNGDPYLPPTNLSDTNLFSDMQNLVPVEGVVEYDVNVPLWNDYAVKKRWLALPNGTKINNKMSEKWEFPKNTVLIKHFGMETSPGNIKKLETRLLINQDRGWYGYLYKWNAAQTDAVLQSAESTESFSVAAGSLGGARTASWTYPTNSCNSCHATASSRPLGVKTHQLNRTFSYNGTEVNQLSTWNAIGMLQNNVDAKTAVAFSRWGDDAAPDARLARAYLDVNCSSCHGETVNRMDFRYTTEVSDGNYLNVANRVVAGDKDTSEVYKRMNTNTSSRMPQMGSDVVHDEAVEIIGNWIDGL